MATILSLEGIHEDPRPRIAQDAWADPSVPAWVGIGQWLAWRAAALRPHPDAGVWLRLEDDVAALAAEGPGLAFIAIDFPVFTDGRGYSMARLLRERHGYRGQLRATGDILRDQLWFLHQVGFDAFELRADQDRHAARQAFADYVLPEDWKARSPGA